MYLINNLFCEQEIFRLEKELKVAILQVNIFSFIQLEINRQVHLKIFNIKSVYKLFVQTWIRGCTDQI